MVAIQHTPSSRADRRASFAARLGAAADEDRRLYRIIAAYLVFAGALALHFHRLNIPQFLDFVTSWSLGAVSATLLYLAVRVLLTLAVERPSRPAAWLTGVLQELVTPELLAGLMFYGALGAFVGAFTSVKGLLPSIIPFHFDPALSRLDSLVHGGRAPWDWLQPVLGRHWITRLIEVCYHLLWGLLVALCPLLISAYAKDRRLRAHYLTAFLLAWIVFGTILACLFMSGGPAFYGLITGDRERYARLVAYLAFDRSSPISAAASQGYLWRAYQAGATGTGTGISAFPSMHVTMAMLCTFAGWRIHHWLGVVLTVFCCAIVVGSVHLGWHYAIGDYVVMPSVLALWWASGKLVLPANAADQPPSGSLSSS